MLVVGEPHFAQAPLSVGAASVRVSRDSPPLALLTGAALSYAATTGPAVATGYGDRRPQRTPGRLRRVLDYR